MDSRSAAHVLAQIGDLLDLRGAPRFKSKAYRNAARAVLALGADDLAPLLKSGELKNTPGIGPATLSVIQELLEAGESSYLQQLSEGTPPGVAEMMRIPGLTPPRIELIRTELDIESLEELEAAARDGRLAALPRFGPRIAERILKAIEFSRTAGPKTLYYRAVGDAVVLQQTVLRHPDVVEAVIAGSLRRRLEVIRDVDIVALCRQNPEQVAQDLANARGVKRANVDGSFAAIEYVDGMLLDLLCVTAPDYGVALLRMTGTPAHVEAIATHARNRGYELNGNKLLAPNGKPLRLRSEELLYKRLELPYIVPELREGTEEVAAAALDELPDLIEYDDIQGVLHCHTTDSDGTLDVEGMAEAARARGWKYIGISDHSQAAHYAGGLKPDEIARQHEVIDRLNSRWKNFRILKGIEADILADGQLDYDGETLDKFDYVIGSVHSRFSMDEAKMTERVLRAMDDPHLTILGHPTGRLLLSREGYAIDMDAVIAKAVENRLAVELNADPHRLDLDWMHCRQAKSAGAMIAIGPDAHSEIGLDVMDIGIGLARKAWLEPADVLNAQPLETVLAVAAARRSG